MPQRVCTPFHQRNRPCALLIGYGLSKLYDGVEGSNVRVHGIAIIALRRRRICRGTCRPVRHSCIADLEFKNGGGKTDQEMNNRGPVNISSSPWIKNHLLFALFFVTRRRVSNLAFMVGRVTNLYVANGRRNSRDWIIFLRLGPNGDVKGNGGREAGVTVTGVSPKASNSSFSL
ncbi:hypothetical protein VNO77_08009 [Canavalia gladiata]|uniref:Uncharacterized protein n=1 Tax=Canavalia gladiata TaxID=3824 RepID=A0AAN9MBX0_CANGL